MAAGLRYGRSSVCITRLSSVPNRLMHISRGRRMIAKILGFVLLKRKPRCYAFVWVCRYLGLLVRPMLTTLREDSFLPGSICYRSSSGTLKTGCSQRIVSAQISGNSIRVEINRKASEYSTHFACRDSSSLKTAHSGLPAYAGIWMPPEQAHLFHRGCNYNRRKPWSCSSRQTILPGCCGAERWIDRQTGKYPTWAIAPELKSSPRKCRAFFQSKPSQLHMNMCVLATDIDSSGMLQ